MNKENLWAFYMAQNPKIANEMVTLTKAGLRKFFDTTFNEGFLEGQRKVKSVSNEMPEFLKQIFK